MTNEQIKKLADGIGGMVREWMTGPNPLAGDGLENVIEKRLQRELPARPKLEAVAQLGGAPDDLRNLILVALRSKSLVEIQAITAEVISRRDPSLAPAEIEDGTGFDGPTEAE